MSFAKFTLCFFEENRKVDENKNLHLIIHQHESCMARDKKTK